MKNGKVQLEEKRIDVLIRAFYNEYELKGGPFLDIRVILSQMLQLFGMMVIGYVLYKLQIMDLDFNKRLNKIIMSVSLPALVLSSVLSQETTQGTVVRTLFVIAVVMYLVLPVIAYILVRILRIPKEQQGVYMFMTVYSNIGFMGYPVVNAIYGPTGVFYASIFNIIFNLSAFTMGVFIIRYGQKDSVKFEMKRVLTPGFLGCVLAIILYFCKVRFPDLVMELLGTVGGLTTPLAMILMGSILAAMDIKEIFNDHKVYLYAVIKQILLPLLMWPLIRWAIKDPLILGITFLLAAMPIANMSVLFATEYHRDEKLAAKNVFITTLLSIITVPLVMYICQLS